MMTGDLLNLEGLVKPGTNRVIGFEGRLYPHVYESYVLTLRDFDGSVNIGIPIESLENTTYLKELQNSATRFEPKKITGGFYDVYEFGDYYSLSISNEHIFIDCEGFPSNITGVVLESVLRVVEELAPAYFSKHTSSKQVI